MRNWGQAQCDNSHMQHNIPDDDLYGALGIQAHAQHAEITRAYRKLAMAWHPDRNASHEAEDRFRRIRLAYEVLRDPQRRAEYDRRARRPTMARTQSSSSGATPEQPSRTPPESPAARAGNLSRRVAIALEDQVFGCRVALKVTRTEYCRTCGGAGRMESRPTACPSCRGSGRIRKPMLPFFLFAGEEVDCDACGGAGRILPECPTCKGSGNGATRTGHLRFDLPAGIRPDTTKRVRAFGRPARPGETPGDLLVKVKFATHPLFEPDFPHLRCEIPVSAFRVLAGGSIDVPTLEGTMTMALPQDADDGTLLRLAGQGLLDGDSGQRGDLFATLRVVRPKALTAAQRALVDELENSFADARGQVDEIAEWARLVRQAKRHRDRCTKHKT